jgi:hypothetical protein
MRLVLAGILATGLLLVGVGVYDVQQAPAGTTVSATTCEDGTGFPPPYPPPHPTK